MRIKRCTNFLCNNHKLVSNITNAYSYAFIMPKIFCPLNLYKHFTMNKKYTNKIVRRKDASNGNVSNKNDCTRCSALSNSMGIAEACDPTSMISSKQKFCIPGVNCETISINKWLSDLVTTRHSPKLHGLIEKIEEELGVKANSSTSTVLSSQNV